MASNQNSMKKVKKKTYTKKTMWEHIVSRSQTYIGSITPVPTEMYISDKDNNVVLKSIKFVQGLYKIFDEVIVNSADQVERVNTLIKNGGKHERRVTEIRVTIDKDSFCVKNNGNGIEIEFDEEEQMYTPTLIFGVLLTSSNYDDEVKRTIGGTNGYGAKLANIFSKYFRVRTRDHKTNQVFEQIWENNMTKCNPHKLWKGNHKFDDDKKGFTGTEFYVEPDFSKFGVKHLTRDMIALFKRRVYDIAATTPKTVSVYLNGELISIKNFKDYVMLYKKDNEEVVEADSVQDEDSETMTGEFNVVGEISNERWEYYCVVNSLKYDTFRQVSFVNGVYTQKGGTHVAHVREMLVTRILDTLNKKKKYQEMNIKRQYIKNCMFLFLRCVIENPEFTGQTKQEMKTPSSMFGSACKISDTIVKRLVNKTDLAERVLSFTRHKNKEILSKKFTSKRRKKRLHIPKYQGANKAGTKDSLECHLILTEGDSALALAIAGLSVVGRDLYGAFPLKGKVLNVLKNTLKKAMDNSEISNLMKIIGLELNVDYTKKDNLDKLRYGSIVVMTDADHDGNHIKGLLITFFQKFFPTLLDRPGFLKSFITPIVKVSNGKKVHAFYNQDDYEEWMDKHKNEKKWKAKYYKGLGTSTSKEGREYFSQWDKHVFPYIIKDKKEMNAAVKLAFGPDTMKRKSWLIENKQHDTKDNKSIVEFIHTDVKDFDIYTMQTKLPSAIDGLKPSQRKALYTCMIKAATKEIKVGQLTGATTELTLYHHGEKSMEDTIKNLAQVIVGKSNINLFLPNGQFGTRLQGGKDAASARYINTQLNPIVNYIFPKDDMKLLKRAEADGVVVEPVYYVPIIPMILVNGGSGIATGFSSNVPNYNPEDLVEALYDKMAGKEMRKLVPWYKDYTGDIFDSTKANPHEYVTHGKFTVQKNIVTITELPIESWTQKYTEFLEKMIDEGQNEKKKARAKAKKSKKNSKTIVAGNSKMQLLDYKTECTDKTIKLYLRFKTDMEGIEQNVLRKKLKLVSRILTSNMNLWNSNNQLIKYNSVKHIIDDFYEVRLGLYKKRIDYLIKHNERLYSIAYNKRRYIEEVMTEKLNIFRRKKEDVHKDLVKLKYSKFDMSSSVLDTNCDMDGTFDYLTSMPNCNFFIEEVEKLKQKETMLKTLLEKLKKTRPVSMWKTELKEFITHYKKYRTAEMKDIEAENGKYNKAKKAKRKTTRMRRKK